MNKKSTIYFLLMLCFYNIAKAQNVGIGTRNPNSSAILEVSSNARNGGVLLPKVNLRSAIDVSTIPSPAVGLMVYNTNTAGVKPNEVEADHHYFWDGSRWTDLADINTIKNLLLPQVFFCQEPFEQELTIANRATVNSGGDLLVTLVSSMCSQIMVITSP